MKSEGSQHIYRMHKPNIKTEFGDRCMEEIGNIKGLEVDETANYVLVPIVSNGKATGWHIFRIKKECDVDVETFDNL